MSNYTEGAIHQLANQLERVGFTDEEVKKLGDTDTLVKLLSVLRSTHQIKSIDHNIDTSFVCDISQACKVPFDGAARKVQYVPVGNTIWILIPRNGELFVNRGNGEEKLTLHYSTRQLNGETIKGHELRLELDTNYPEARLPAALLDYLVTCSSLWPESWKKDTDGNIIKIYFWGDIFYDRVGLLCVRFAYWENYRVVPHYFWLNYNWDINSPAALFERDTKSSET